MLRRIRLWVNAVVQVLAVDTRMPLKGFLTRFVHHPLRPYLLRR